MNRSEFTEILGENKSHDRQLLAEINELVALFPWFQSGHLLLLRTLHRMSDVKFESQLRSSALYIADREVLYYMLNTSYTGDDKKKAEETTAVQGNEDTVQAEYQQTVIDDARNSDDLICEIEKDDGDGSGRGYGDVAPEVVSRAILTGDDFDEDGRFDSTILQLDDEPEPAGEEIVYMDPGFSVPEKSELLELENGSTAETREKKEDTETANDASRSEMQGSERRMTESDLIERFILANPRIEPVRGKTDTPREDISTPFLEDTGSFVTETLARIYLNQGYYSKAIDIYEKLSLKFPEKSSYFAAQIEKIKELIK